MIVDNINKQIAEALKAKDVVRLSTLRLLSSAFNYEKIAKQHELSEEEELAVVRREAKKRQDAIESIRQAQGKNTSSDQSTLDQRLEQETKELEILKEYLPAQMDDSELVNLVNQVIKETGAESMKDIGKVIGEVVKRAEGRAEGGMVAEIVKSKLK